MKHFLMILGTRPEAIKMAPLKTAMDRANGLSVHLLHTGQHAELTDGALAAFGITPDLRLPPPPVGRSLSELTAHLLLYITEALQKEQPRAVLIHGDTTTAFAASLASFYTGIPVIHVEAGLRSGAIRAPFPEEFNRRAAALTAALHFAPTEQAREHLLNEGVSPTNIFVVGNTGIDALRYTVRSDFSHPLLTACEGKRMLLFTAHRRESWGAPLRGMLQALKTVLAEHTDTVAILPMHPNPALQAVIQDALGGNPRVILTAPMEVDLCHNLLARSTLVMTDSGGLQEEASALGIPTLVMRQCTERQEGLAESGGPLTLVGQEDSAIASAARSLLSDPARYARASQRTAVFGDGFASERIAAVLKEWGEDQK